jgi:hypothetical protein
MATHAGLQPKFSWEVNDTLMPFAIDTFLVLSDLKRFDSLLVNMRSSKDCAFPAEVRSAWLKPLILPKPNAEIVLQQNTLFASGPSGIQYQWFRNGNVIPGATESTYLATDSGFYSVRLFNGFGCTDTSASIFVLLTSDLNHGQARHFKVFPSPASDLLFIDSGNEDVTEVEVHDVLGKNISVPKQNRNSISIATFPNGFYTITCTVNGQRQTRKFIKQ